MARNHQLLTQKELHSLFINDLKCSLKDIIDNGKKPLLLSLSYPFNRELKVYIFNCTSPQGGRSFDEFKIQLIIDGQKRGKRGRFNTSDGRTTLIVGYITLFSDSSHGIWVLFELDKHREFAYSANIQVYLRQILPALEKNIHICQKHNNEILVLAQRKYLKEALQKRFDIDFQIMLERTEDGIKEI